MYPLQVEYHGGLAFEFVLFLFLLFFVIFNSLCFWPGGGEEVVSIWLVKGNQKEPEALC